MFCIYCGTKIKNKKAVCKDCKQDMPLLSDTNGYVALQPYQKPKKK